MRSQPLIVCRDGEARRPLVPAPARLQNCAWWDRIESARRDRGPMHREVWLEDPDAYKVVLASPDGEAA
jgi:hypothetical protein